MSPPRFAAHFCQIARHRDAAWQAAYSIGIDNTLAERQLTIAALWEQCCSAVVALFNFKERSSPDGNRSARSGRHVRSQEKSNT